jgi:hypothetical protein
MHSNDEALPRVRSGTARSPLPLRDAVGVLWRFLEGFSQRKAAAEILDLARRLQPTRPETAAQMRRAASRSWD